MKKIILLPIFLLAILLSSAVLATNVDASWSLSEDGHLVYDFRSGSVMGDDDDKEDDHEEDEDDQNEKEEEREDDKDEDEQEEEHEDESDDKDDDDVDDDSNGGSNNGSSNSGSSSIQETESEKVEYRFTDPDTGVETKAKTEDGKTEIEVRNADGSKYKFKSEDDGRQRTDVYQDGVHIRLEKRDDRVIIKAETEGGSDDEVELGEQSIFKIEDRTDKNEIRVATGSGNALKFSRNGVAAETEFPLSINVIDNSLVVETSAGLKTVTILPDEAVSALLKANLIDKLLSDSLDEVVTSLSDAGNEVNSIELGEQDGQLVYEVEGVSEQKLLGIFPVQVKRTVTVSAETSELISVDKSIADRFLDAFSF
jgi:hypothetical protein